MTYTADQAIEMAREVMNDPEDGEISGLFLLEPEELTALCNKVREQTLLEAADALKEMQGDKSTYADEKLRRMAEGER